MQQFIAQNSSNIFQYQCQSLPELLLLQLDCFWLIFMITQPNNNVHCIIQPHQENLACFDAEVLKAKCATCKREIRTYCTCDKGMPMCNTCFAKHLVDANNTDSLWSQIQDHSPDTLLDVFGHISANIWSQIKTKCVLETLFHAESNGTTCSAVVNACHFDRGR